MFVYRVRNVTDLSKRHTDSVSPQITCYQKVSMTQSADKFHGSAESQMPNCFQVDPVISHTLFITTDSRQGVKS